MKQTSTLPEEAIIHRAAVGHIKPSPGAAPEVAPVWMLPRACGPMGLINSTVADVLTFARLHLDGGAPRTAPSWCSADGIAAMQRPQVESPDRYTLGSHWGLGVILFDWDGHRLYGHDGGTIGQASMLRILPEAGMAMCLLANGGDVEPVYRALFGELAAELAGIAMPPPLEAPATPPALDLDRYAGSFKRLSLRYDLARGRPPRRDGDAERAARRAGSGPGDQADAHARRCGDVPGPRGGVADAGAGGVLRVQDGVPQYFHSAPAPTPESPLAPARPHAFAQRVRRRKRRPHLSANSAADAERGVRQLARPVASAFGSAHESLAA